MKCPICEHIMKGPLWRVPGLSVVKCLECGFYAADLDTWVYPYSEKDYYGENIKISEIDPNRNYVRHRVGQICRFISGGRSVDLGSGLGATAIALALKGFDAHGVEESLNAVTFLQQHFSIVTWHNMRIDQFLKNNNGYDLITLFHALEHVQQPRQLCRQIVDAMNPRGWLVVEVPDVTGGQARIWGWRWQHWLPHHINYFCLKTLRMLLEPMGLRLRYLERKYHATFPQGIHWKDIIHDSLAHLRFHDIITTYWKKDAEDGRQRF